MSHIQSNSNEAQNKSDLCSLCGSREVSQSRYVACGISSYWEETAETSQQLSTVCEQDGLALWHLRLCFSCLAGAVVAAMRRKAQDIQGVAASGVLVGGLISVAIGFPLYYVHTRYPVGVWPAVVWKVGPFILVCGLAVLILGIALAFYASWIKDRAKAYEEHPERYLVPSKVREQRVEAAMEQAGQQILAKLERERRVLTKLERETVRSQQFSLPAPSPRPMKAEKHPERNYSRNKIEYKIIGVGKTENETVPWFWKSANVARK